MLFQFKTIMLILFIFITTLIAACSLERIPNIKKKEFNFISNSELDSSTCTFSNMSKNDKLKKIEEISSQKDLKIATFAGGCFWCIESKFEKVNGVVVALSGYTGGDTLNPTYKEVSTGTTGHYESVEVYYDPKIISYTELLDIYFKQINPIDNTGQFVDRGSQYLPAIFYHNENQKKLSNMYIESLEESKIFDSKIVVEIKPAQVFYLAEDYHQDYFKKSPINYKLYRKMSGRDNFIENTWENQKDTEILKEDLKNKLTPLEYKVTQEQGTETPFNNKYWNNHEDGIYVDLITGEPLFSSNNKYDSGTGWPAFTKPISNDNIIETTDFSSNLDRVEVKSNSGSHLGHVFEDGPEEMGGQRFCINSASLRFISKDELVEKGYEKYLKEFE